MSTDATSATAQQAITPDGGYIYGKFVEIFLDGAEWMDLQKLQGNVAENFTLQATTWEGGVQTISLGALDGGWTGSGTFEIQLNGGLYPQTVSVGYASGDSVSNILDDARQILETRVPVKEVFINSNGELEIELWASMGGTVSAYTTSGFTEQPVVSPSTQSVTQGTPYTIGVEEVWASEDSLLFVLDTADANYTQNLQHWSDGLLSSTDFQLTSNAVQFFDGYTDVSLPQFQVDLANVFSTHSIGSERYSIPTSGNAEDVLDFFVADDTWIDNLILEDGIWAQESPMFMTFSGNQVNVTSFSTNGSAFYGLDDFTPEAIGWIESNQPTAESDTLEHLYVMEHWSLSGLAQEALSQFNLDAFHPLVTAPTSVSVTGGLSTVTVQDDLHGLVDGDYVIIKDGSITDGKMFGGIEYAPALLGYFEVDVTDDNSFTFQARESFTSSETTVSLNTIDPHLNFVYAKTVENEVYDQIFDAVIDSMMGQVSYFAEVSGSVVSSDGVLTFGPQPLETVYASLTGNVSVADWSPGSTNPVYTNELITSNFGLLKLLDAGLHDPSDTQGFMLATGLLSPHGINGGNGDDLLFVGGSYMPQYSSFGEPPAPIQYVPGGSGNDTLILLGQPSDYSLTTVSRLLLDTYEFIDATVESTSRLVTISHADTTLSEFFNGPVQGDLVEVVRPGVVEVGNPTFYVQDGVYEAVVEDFYVTPGTGWTLKFVLPEGVSLDGWGQDLDLVRLSYASVLDLNLTNSDGAFSFPLGAVAPPLGAVAPPIETYVLAGKDTNSFDMSSELFSTVVATTELRLFNIEKIQFVSDWPEGPVAPIVTEPEEIDLGYLPRNDIKIKQLGTDDSVITEIPEVVGETNVLRVLDATGRSNIVIDSALGEVYDYSAESFGGYSIGPFGGYVVSGSDVAFLGDSDLSEIVVVEGAGTNLNFALSGESFSTDYGDGLFDAGETGGHLNAIAFTGQTHGINIDLSVTNDEGYASFTNGQTATPDLLEGLVRGARAVIGSTQDDVITGLYYETSILSGGGGNDSITGGLGDDWIIVGGESTAVGGAGDDIIVDWGASTLTGGAGKDSFFLGANKHVDSGSTLTHLADFEFAADGGSRPGRSSSWEDRVGVSLSVTALNAMGVFGTSSTAEGGETLSARDYQALRNAIDFEVTEVTPSETDRVDVVIHLDAPDGVYSPTGTTKVILASFTVDTSGLSASEAVNVFTLPDSPLAVGADNFSIPGKLDIFDLFMYPGLDGGSDFDLTSYGEGLTEKTILGSQDPLFDGSPQSNFAIADDFVFLRLSMERSDANTVRPDFPPQVPAGAPLTLFARNDSGVEIAAKFEGSNANETFVGGALKDEYRFVKETFFRDDTTVDPVQSFGRDLVVERNSFRNDTGVRDVISAKDLDVSDAVFARTEIGREGEVSLSVTWGEGSGLNAGDVSVLRQYSNISSMFRVEDIELSDDGAAATTTT